MTFETLDSGIDVGHGINVWPGKFGRNKKAIGPRKNPKLVKVRPTFIHGRLYRDVHDLFRTLESRVSYLYCI